MLFLPPWNSSVTSETYLLSHPSSRPAYLYWRKRRLNLPAMTNLPLIGARSRSQNLSRVFISAHFGTLRMVLPGSFADCLAHPVSCHRPAVSCGTRNILA